MATNSTTGNGDYTYTITSTTATGVAYGSGSTAGTVISFPWVSAGTTYTWTPTSMYVDETTGETIVGNEEIEKYFRKKFFAEDLKKIIDE